METPKLKVGILNHTNVSFRLEQGFHLAGKVMPKGNYLAEISGEGVELKDNKGNFLAAANSLTIENSGDAAFTLQDVVIGIGFHWERKEDQSFVGDLILLSVEDHIAAINHVSIEDYLVSVISSEMSATSSRELLEAHAVTSRSWLLAQLDKRNHLAHSEKELQSNTRDEHQWIQWFDREDHQHYDVCADDHCQRYQGTTRQTSKKVKEAIAATRGQVLINNGKIADARFYKCCGGITELFEKTWEPIHHEYLLPVKDFKEKGEASSLADASLNEKAEHFIKEEKESFCNTQNPTILEQVLNDYDQETQHFYRWEQHYSQEELTDLLKERVGIDFGKVLALNAIERGPSARIIKLEIKGTRRTLTIGKELFIRKALSSSHLYSSAFYVEEGQKDNDKAPASFTLRGAGWGHGVGLCQIGAAVMASKGFSPEEILEHYFPNTTIKNNYNQ